MDAATIVKRIRTSSGITRKELAELAQLSPSTVGRIESGTLDPTWGTLSRILESSGFRLHGDSLASAGDPSAAAAARWPLEEALAAAGKTVNNTTAPAMATIDAQNSEPTDSLSTTGRSLAEASYPPALRKSVKKWSDRWARAGWLSDLKGTEGLVSMALAAGNASRLVRRNASRRYVGDRRQWQELSRQIDDAGFEYAVSGLLATREDRATAASLNPLIYVRDPAEVVTQLSLEESAPGRGVLLVEATGVELEGVEVDNGIRFTSSAQAILDALAGSGREPDKAEAALQRMLEASA